MLGNVALEGLGGGASVAAEGSVFSPAAFPGSPEEASHIR